MVFRRSGVVERVGGDELDPAQDESVSGAWNFTGGLKVGGLGVLNLINVSDYDGADDVAKAQAALDAAIAAGGGIVYWPAGEYDWTGAAAGLKLRRNLDSDVRITLWGPGAKIVLSATTQQFISYDRQADFDTFRNYTIDGFDVDCSAVVVSDSSIKYIVGGSWSRTNYEDLTFRRMRLTNLARIGTGVAGWTHAFACKFSGDNSEGQTIYARRITFEDIRVEGGNSAIEVAGYLNGDHSQAEHGCRR
jgi:hypothetical protein